MSDAQAAAAARAANMERAAAQRAAYAASWAHLPDRDAARHFRVTRATIRRWRRRLDLPYRRRRAG